MTYTRRVRTRLRKPTSLGDWWGDFMNNLNADLGLPTTRPSDEAQCIALANATFAPMDAKVNDLSANWNPTGFYTPDEIRTQVANVMDTVRTVQVAIDQARAEPNASQDSIMRAVNDLARVGERSLGYLAAANNADQNGIRLVNAQGLKRWVVDSLATCSSSMVTAAVVGCIAPWWIGSLATFQRAFDKAWSTAKLLIGAVLAIGETAVLVANDLPDLYRVLKYTALVVGGYLLWERYLAKD
jgi:hypothetical protein